MGGGPGQGTGGIPRSSVRGPSSALEPPPRGRWPPLPFLPSAGSAPHAAPGPLPLGALCSAVLWAFTGVSIHDSCQIRLPSSTSRCFKCPHFYRKWGGQTQQRDGTGFLRLKSQAWSRHPSPFVRTHSRSTTTEPAPAVAWPCGKRPGASVSVGCFPPASLSSPAPLRRLVMVTAVMTQ